MKKKTLCLVMHSLYLHNRFSELITAGHVFILGSPNSVLFVNKIKHICPDIEPGYEYICQKDYAILYVNLNKNYCLGLDIVNNKLIPEKMFANGEIYSIHLENDSCSENNKDSENILKSDYFREILQTYTTNRKKVLILTNLLIKNGFLEDNDTLMIRTKKCKYKLHIVDFFSLCLNVSNKMKLSKNQVVFFKAIFSEAKYSFPRSIFPTKIKQLMKNNV